jgi:hypothetical protein
LLVEILEKKMISPAANSIVRPTSVSEVKELNLPYLPPDLSVALQAAPKMSLRSQQSNVKNQMRGDFCTTFAALAGFEFVIKNGRGGTASIPDVDLSEAHATYAGEKRHGDCQPGIPIWVIMEAISYNGVVLEDVWQFDQLQTCAPNPPDRSNAAWFTLKQYALVSLVEHDEIMKNIKKVANGESATIFYSSDILRNSLATQNTPCIVDIPLFPNAGWESSNGDVHLPTSANASGWLDGNSAGDVDWHCICVTGYDDTTRRFEFKNSWGAMWGDIGYGTISYEYISAFNRTVFDFRGSYVRWVGPPPTPWGGAF